MISLIIDNYIVGAKTKSDISELVKEKNSYSVSFLLKCYQYLMKIQHKVLLSLSVETKRKLCF